MLCRGVVSVEPFDPFRKADSAKPADRTDRRIDADLFEKMTTILQDATPRPRPQK
jgi:hypothetical protein